MQAERPAAEPTPPPEGRSGTLWSRHSRRGKILIVIGALVLMFAAIAACSGSDDSADSEEAASTTETTAEEEAESPPTPRAPPPIVVRGSGAQVEAVNIANDSPAVVAGVHRGAANFIVRLVAPGGQEAFLFNEIGNYSGEVAWAEAAAGRARLSVEADGTWTISISQPVPRPRDKTVPGTFTGRGTDVVKLRADDDLQPVITSTHRGQANFIVQLIGYGDTSGHEFLVNEIGNYSGETLLPNLSAGNYLLAVQADGPWTIKFAP